MKIILKQLQLSYFKGIRSLTVDFNEHVQNIHGANETGKSTVFNAFLWLLFGKDMEGRTDYQIKTTDDQGNEIPKVDHEVVGNFLIDGQEVIMKRTYKEKWVKPRGAATAELQGHQTEFEWNGVPMREKDYQEKINGIMKEDIFKLLTNPLYFNEGLKGYKLPDWQARRNVLLDLAGDIKDAEVAAGDTRFEDLLKKITGKSLDEYKKQIAAQKKKVREQLDAIPTRIDEATRALPEPLDFAEIDRLILAKNEGITNIDQQLTNATEAQKERNNEQLAKQNEIHDHRSRLQTIESEIRSQFNQEKIEREGKVRELRANGRTKESELTNLKTELRRLEGQKSVVESKMVGLRADWAKADGQKPEEMKDDFKCPSCGQDLPETRINAKKEVYAKYVADFNDNKVKRLAEITKAGQEMKTQVADFETSVQATKDEISRVEKEMEELRGQISDLETETARLNQEADQTIQRLINDNEESHSIHGKIDALAAHIEQLKSASPDNADLKATRQGLVSELDTLKRQRDTKDQIERGRKRIIELETEEKDLAQQMVELEGVEFVIQEFTKAKIDMLEDRINHKFKYARFKLFDRQVNGQEVECCEMMYKGVVFGTLNTAAKVLVGIDIINVLSAHYGVSAPIFLDNRESVTSIPDTDAQIINLIVSPDDKQLRVA